MGRRTIGRRLFGALSIEVALLSTIGCGVAMTVYLVRHAEKQPPAPGAKPEKDPPLSEAGVRRAQALVGAMANVNLAAVFATQYKRTQQTVDPVAKAKGLAIEIVDAGDTPALAARIRGLSGKAVLVAGHSNTVPEIAAALGASDGFAIEDDQFGDLFVLEPRTGWVSRGRFG
ncbi:MAG: histidine phosphatase family protein [Myxococcales bacterium]|nr:histidine phosphatase family protein [Myxococcales bacterium]